MGMAELFARGAQQHGVVTAACARASDVPSSTFHDVIRRERWRSLFPGAVLLPGAVPTVEARITAAQLSVGGFAPVCRWTAAYLHGLVHSNPRMVQLWVTPPRRDRLRPGLVVRRSATITKPDTETVDSILRTTAARTLLDLAGEVTLDRLRFLAIDARYQRRLRLPELGSLVERVPNAAGHANLVRVVGELEGDGSDSGFEFVICDRLVAAGYPPSGQQERLLTSIGPCRFDIVYRPEKVALECQGFAYHGSREQFERDAVRSNAIAEIDDWLLLRVTWRMLYGDAWDAFLATLIRVLDRRRSRR